MRFSVLFLFVFSFCSPVFPQVSTGAGTIQGVVTDPTGASIPGATVTIHNPVSGYQRDGTTGEDGAFVFRNVPPNPYHLAVTANGFANKSQDVEVRSTVPVNVKLMLDVAGSTTSVQVEASSQDLVETVPSAHTDTDQSLYSKMPLSAGSGMADLITLASPGVVADSNGFYHPLGDHAQSSLYVDGQPITDQQSKQFSTQIPMNAIQSMELTTSTPSAEFGDKTSLVATAVTRSGMGTDHPFGELDLHGGNFGSYGEDFNYGFGTPKFGFFMAANSSDTSRFLDTPEFDPLHDQGNTETFFNRLDYQPGQNDSVHVNFFLARNWFQIPNTYDQQAAGQDQRQESRTFSVAPNWVHTFNSAFVMTWNPFVREDFINYYPSDNPYADLPATIGEKRWLKNFGTRGDLSWVKSKSNFKSGIQIERTAIHENFRFAITQAGFVDPSETPGLVPYDLTEGGHYLAFVGSANIDEFAWYAQDSITVGNLTLNGGVRVDVYRGLSSANAFEPRAGIAYRIKRSGTVLRAGYSHTLETPYNENLILSSSTGVGGLAENAFGAYGAAPLKPGRRDQYNAGFEQAIGKRIVFSADYFWKYTFGAFDFDTLLNTPLVFPISWDKSKNDGVSGRMELTPTHGVTAFTSFGHTRARYFPPETGGLIFNSPVDTSVFRIDHDQAFQQTTYIRYESPLKKKPWAALTWRFDSGEVAGAVTDLDDLLALDADEQAAVGFYCGSQIASLGHPITSCTSPDFGATRLVIPAPGTYNPDHNPPRVTPRNLLDLGLGTDNLYVRERFKVKLQLTVTNLMNNEALYNFLSTFSGTHFVGPRTYEAELGFIF
ncbi:MAG TPA: TonB-dependent receptor [Bryobacteraceae bacterium]|nr:TonB-dependent receptor [Bryobacteraceae bacterium]